MQNDTCQLCGLSCKTTIHHLIPQHMSRSTKYDKSLKTDENNFLYVCEQCHRQIHALFSNQELRDMYFTKELLLSNEKMQSFVKWRRKHPSFNGSSKKCKH